MGRAPRRKFDMPFVLADRSRHQVIVDSSFAMLRAAAKKLGPHRSAPALARLRRVVVRKIDRDLGLENRRTSPTKVPWVSADVAAGLRDLDLEAAFDPGEADIPQLELGYDLKVEPADEDKFCRLLADTEAEGHGQSQIPPKFTRLRDEMRDRYHAAVAENPALVFVDFSRLDYGGQLSSINRGSATVDELWICYNAWLGREHSNRAHWELHLAKKTMSRSQFERALRDGARPPSRSRSRSRARRVSSDSGSVSAGSKLWLALYLGPGPTLETGKIQLATVGTGSALPDPLSGPEAEIWGEAHVPRAATTAPRDLGSLVKRAFVQFSRAADRATGVRLLETDHGSALAAVVAEPIELFAVDKATGAVVSRTVVSTVAAVGTVFPARGYYAAEDDVRRFVAERAAASSPDRVAAKYRIAPATVREIQKRHRKTAFASVPHRVVRTLKLRDSLDAPLVPAAAAAREAAATSVAGILWDEQLPLVWPGRPVFQQLDLAQTLPIKPRTKGYGDTDRPPGPEPHLIANLGGGGVNFGWSHAAALRPFLRKRGSSRDLTKLSVDDLIARLEGILVQFETRESRARAFEDVDELVAETRALLGRVHRAGRRLRNERYEAVRLINRSMVAVDTHARHDQTSCGPQRLRLTAAFRWAATAILLEAQTLLGGAAASRIVVPPVDLSRPFGFSYVTTRPDAEWRATLAVPVRIAVDGVVVIDSAGDAADSAGRIAAGFVAEIIGRAAATSRDTAILVGARETPITSTVDRLEREALARRINGTVDMLRAAFSARVFRLLAARFGLQTV